MRDKIKIISIESNFNKYEKKTIANINKPMKSLFILLETKFSL